MGEAGQGAASAYSACMIERHDGIGDLFRIFGSVVPRSLIWGILGAVEGYLCDSSNNSLFARPDEDGSSDSNEQAWFHPYSIHVFGTVIGFALVMRVQIAYQRFWEGATHLRMLSSKLGDAAQTLITFDEAKGKDGRPPRDEAAFSFRLQAIHFCSLFHAVALIEVRQDEVELERAGWQGQGVLSLNARDPYLFTIQPMVPKPPSAEDVSGTPAGSPSAALAHRSFSRRSASPLHSATVAPSRAPPAAAPAAHPQAKDSLGGSQHGWCSGAANAVPMQQVLRMRRMLSAQSGLTIANFDSFQPTDAPEGNRQQPWSVKQRRRPIPQLGGSGHGQSSGQWSRLRNVQCTELSSGAQPKELSPSSSSPPAKSSTGMGGWARRAKNVSRLEYMLATVMLQHSRRWGAKLTSANRFDVVGGVSEVELALLRRLPVGDRCYVVMTWMNRLIVSRLNEGGLAIPPPLLARTFESLSAANTAAQQATKLSSTPFPYPLRQLLAVLLLAFQVLVPMCVAAFVDSPPLVAALCFFICLGFMALNETARELEHPFGIGANHLPVVAYQEAFNSKVARLVHLTFPDLGYVPSAHDLVSPQRGEGSPPLKSPRLISGSNLRDQLTSLFSFEAPTRPPTPPPSVV